ncbi:hypothetical protein [Methanolobus psychrotolerans]|uniref:hypothetical protein n=1 Tax=Methanolobus psychrotolerans TaxID=1874706 RepID=UPI0013ECF9C0|nr:hypothetical protein [Methanolobus psychrotolerans]
MARVCPARTEMLSCPGALPPLNKDNLIDVGISSRRYLVLVNSEPQIHSPLTELSAC